MRNSFNLLCGLLVFAALPVPDQDEVGVPGSDLLPAIRTQLIQRVLTARSRNCARDFDLVLSEQGSLLGGSTRETSIRDHARCDCEYISQVPARHRNARAAPTFRVAAGAMSL